jgi:NADPH-dependent curcumin reductase CurA
MTEAMTRVLLAARPTGAPRPEDFRVERAPAPAPGVGQFLARTLWLSLDPYMRGRMDDVKSYAPPVPLGGLMEGEVVAEVVESRRTGFAPGDIVAGRFGWTSHSVSDGVGVRRIDPTLAPVQTALGVLGMPGHTAWVGLTDILAVKAGETVVVSAATGAVGAVACQLAKARGLRVIGVAGSREKCDYAVRELGCDACLDHSMEGGAAALTTAITAEAPRGVDAYYDNVGGVTLEAALACMNDHGRIAVCGAIAWYGGRGVDQAAPLPKVWRAILTKRLTVRGFIVFDHADRHGAFLDEVAPMVRDGRMRYRETVAEGLEAAPEAFIRLLEGGNFGKQLVRVARSSG